jgi:hypothetical protein
MHKLVGRIIPWGLFGRDKFTRPCSTLFPLVSAWPLLWGVDVGKCYEADSAQGSTLHP